jgi:hypothetical protein
VQRFSLLFANLQTKPESAKEIRRGLRAVLFRPSIVNRAVIPKRVNPAYARR